MTPRVALVAAILVACHLTLRVGLGVGSGAPDLLLVAVMVCGRFGGAPAGAAVGLAGGLLEDAMAILSFGASAFALTATGIVAAQARQLTIGPPVLFLTVFIGLGKWMRDLLRWLVADPLSREGFGEYILQAAPMSALYAGVVGALVCRYALGPSLRS